MKTEVVLLVVILGAWGLCVSAHAAPGVYAEPYDAGQDSFSETTIRIVLTPTDDAYVEIAEPDINYGSEESLRTGNGTIDYYRTYLKFDLSQIPNDKNIQSATLALSSNLTYTEPPLVGAHYLDNDQWDENTLTWNNAPTTFNSTPDDEVGVILYYNYWDVTDGVVVAYNDDDVYSVVMKMSELPTAKWAHFESKEGFSFYWPYLEVIYEAVKYGGGSGEPNDPFLIYTAQQMNQVGDNFEDWDKHFRVMADIDLSSYTGTEFKVIGYHNTETDYQAFTGVFDGNGHIISNLNYSASDLNYSGLFGCLGENGVVKNLGLANPNVNTSSGNGAGALVGLLLGGAVRNCFASDVQIACTFRTGGLVGWASDGQIIDSYTEGGTVTVTYNYEGGLVGESSCQITRCYSTCSSGSGFYAGGLVGCSPGGSVVNSFWDKQASSRSYSAGGTGKTTAEMQAQSTFTNAGWDFTTPIWTIDEGVDYPRLSWEQIDTEKYGGGTGTAEDPYQIWTPEQMNEIGLHTEDWDKHFILMTDIDLSEYTGTEFNIIGRWLGYSDPCNLPFTGVFEGNGNTISNFSYSYGATFSTNAGLFGLVEGFGTTIENLDLSGVSIYFNGNKVGAIVAQMANGASLINCSVKDGFIYASNDVGGLVGENNSGTIQWCKFEGIINASATVGGLVGYNVFDGIISNCSSKGTVNGAAYVGGLVGENSFDSLISMCYSLCDVQRRSFYYISFGGLVGTNSQGTIANCYAHGSVTGGSRTGGLAGKNGKIIRNCYATGPVIGTTDVGGLVGYSTGSTFGSFWDVETTGRSGSAGGMAKTTAQMQMQSTFTDYTWDFVGETANGTEDIWTILEGINYPEFVWQGPLAVSLDIDNVWMYQNLPGQTNSELTATVSITDDPLSNSSYIYEWEIILPDDVTMAPVITAGGGFSDPCCKFAAPSCNESGGLSDSGQTFTVRVTITGTDFGNTGIAEAQFGIALLGDANNDGVVNVADRSIINAFWRLGAAGPFTFTDCDINCDEAVNVADRSIANAVWRGVLGQNSVSTPCPFR